MALTINKEWVERLEAKLNDYKDRNSLGRCEFTDELFNILVASLKEGASTPDPKPKKK